MDFGLFSISEYCWGQVKEFLHRFIKHKYVSSLAKYNQVHDSRVSCNHAYASCTQAAATIIDAELGEEITVVEDIGYYTLTIRGMGGYKGCKTINNKWLSDGLHIFKDIYHLFKSKFVYIPHILVLFWYFMI